MTELRRLLDGDSDELALDLLRSAGDDSPSTDSLKAAALALGIGTSLSGSALLASGLRSAGMQGAGAVHAVAGASGGASAVASLTIGAIVKQVAIGLFAGALAMGGLELTSDHPFAADPAPRQVAVSAAHVASLSPARGHALAQLPEPSAPILAADANEAPAQPNLNSGSAALAVRRRGAAADASSSAALQREAEAPLPAPVAAAAPAPAKPAPEVEKAPVALNKSLAAEVALLDRARSALSAQNPSGALRALDQYRKERQTAILDPEATVLQIQVLDKLGEHAAAVRLARKFVKGHPESRHVDSLRVLAAEAL